LPALRYPEIDHLKTWRAADKVSAGRKRTSTWKVQDGRFKRLLTGERWLMEPEQSMTLNQVRRRIEATDADISESTFTNVSLARATFHDVSLTGATIQNADLSGSKLRDVNLSSVRITQANLTGASIADCLTDGMTINGIEVADLMAAYRAAKSTS
jgi:uncharacterized protein YjbI with pentapeptide repeats